MLRGGEERHGHLGVGVYFCAAAASLQERCSWRGWGWCLPSTSAATSHQGVPEQAGKELLEVGGDPAPSRLLELHTYWGSHRAGGSRRSAAGPLFPSSSRGELHNWKGKCNTLHSRSWVLDNEAWLSLAGFFVAVVGSQVPALLPPSVQEALSCPSRAVAPAEGPGNRSTAAEETKRGTQWGLSPPGSSQTHFMQVQLLRDAPRKTAKGSKGTSALQLRMLPQHRASPRACSPPEPAQCLLLLGEIRNQGGTERSQEAPAPGLSWSLQRLALADKSFPKAAMNCGSPCAGLSYPPP